MPVTSARLHLFYKRSVAILHSLGFYTRPQSASYASIHSLLSTRFPCIGRRGLICAPPFAHTRRAPPLCSLPSFRLAWCVRDSLLELCTSDTSGRPPGNVPRVCGPSFQHSLFGICLHLLCIQSHIPVMPQPLLRAKMTPPLSLP